MRVDARDGELAFEQSVAEPAAELANALAASATKPYRKSPWRRGLNALVRPLARLGLAGPRTYVLTVPGRRSGKLWSTPVSIVEAGRPLARCAVRRPQLGEERARSGLGRAASRAARERLSVGSSTPMRLSRPARVLPPEPRYAAVLHISLASSTTSGWPRLRVIRSSPLSSRRIGSMAKEHRPPRCRDRDRVLRPGGSRVASGPSSCRGHRAGARSSPPSLSFTSGSRALGGSPPVGSHRDRSVYGDIAAEIPVVDRLEPDPALLGDA